MPKRDEIGLEREKKNFTPEFRSYLTPARKFCKKTTKKFKKLKDLFSALFLAKMGRDRPRKREKNLPPNSVHTRPRQENSEENSEKISKN